MDAGPVAVLSEKALDGNEDDDDDDRDMFCIPPTLWVNADYRHCFTVARDFEIMDAYYFKIYLL